MAIFLFIRNKLFYLEYEKERKQKQLIEDVGAFFHDFIPNSIILQIGAQVYNIASLDKRKAYTVMVENLVKITFEMFVIQGKSIYLFNFSPCWTCHRWGKILPVVIQMLLKIESSQKNSVPPQTYVTTYFTGIDRNHWVSRTYIKASTQPIQVLLQAIWSTIH